MILALALVCSPGLADGGEQRVVRVTQSGGIGGLTAVLSMTETSSGTVFLDELRNPRRDAPLTRQRVLPADAFDRVLNHLVGLGLTELGDYRQPRIEDAPTYRFRAELGGQPIEFSVVGELKDLEDRRYLRILESLRDPEAIETKP